MKKAINIKEMSRAELEKKYMELSTENEVLSQENAWYREQVKLQQKKLFGRSSEKANNDQISLFDEAEVESAPLNDESSITEVKAHNRKRKTRQLNLDDLENMSATS